MTGHQPTMIERTMEGFDPEKHCRYTGRKLWPFPDLLSGLMIYYREPDAHVSKCRRLTPEEVANLRSNPKETRKKTLEFKAGIEFARNQKPTK